LRIDVRERELPQLAVLEQVHCAPVGDGRHGRLGDCAQRVEMVERRAEQLIGLEQEALRLLGPLLIVNVSRRPDPELDLILLVPNRDRATEVPSIRAVRRSEAVFDLEHVSALERLAPPLDRRAGILGVHDPEPRSFIGLLRRHPRVFEPPPVVVGRLPGAIGGPDDLRHRVGQLPVALLADAALRRHLLLAQQLALPPELLVLAMELDEDGHLRAEHLGLERLEHVVDRARRVAAEHVPLVLRDRGQEDDRNVLRQLPLLDQRSGLEPVEARHQDVEQDAGELLVQQQRAQRLLSGASVNEVLPEGLEDRLERDQVLLDVVDEQQVDALLVHRRTRAGSSTSP
jgi:hypothetical protein